MHRAHHEWEREAWSEVREGEPGLALARYRAHDRLHVYDTRAEATQAMVENWDQTRQGLPPDQTVMITDSSNEERDEMNALAQDRRAQAGELGSDRVELPGKPYGLAAGDEVIFTDKFKIKRLKRVENGITGTVIHANPDENKVTIQTRERPSRKVEVDTEKFSEHLARLRRAHPQGPGTHLRDLAGSSPAAGRQTRSTCTSPSAAPASAPTSTSAARTSASRAWTQEQSND